MSRDRDKLGSGFRQGTLDEHAELARTRAAALGLPVAVCGFTGSDRVSVVDLDVDDDGQLWPVQTVSEVLLEHPSPSLGEPDDD
jgi:hypothetical protein